MEKIYIRILTDKDLGDERFVNSFLKDWFSNFRHISPERFGHGEPINKNIDLNNLDEIEREWQIPPSLMFKRMSSPQYLFDLKWRKHKGLDQRPYPWGANIWLNYKDGKRYVLEFFEFLIDWFVPAYGYVTLDSDESFKHNNALIPQYRNGQYVGMGRSYWGADIGDVLPGVYWLTYISNRVLEPALFKKIDDIAVGKNAGDGKIFQMYEDIESVGSSAARETERKIAERLGGDKFFDLDEFIKDNNGERIP